MDTRFRKGGEYYDQFMRVFAWHARMTDADFDTIAKSCGQFQTPFEADLCAAVVNELERAAKRKAGAAV